MSEQFDALNAKITAQGQKIELQSAVIGQVKGDLDYVKQQLSNTSGVLTPEEVAALNQRLDENSAKVDANLAALQALDAETDSTGGTPTPEPPAGETL